VRCIGKKEKKRKERHVKGLTPIGRMMVI